MIWCSLDGRFRSPRVSRLLDEGVQTCRQQSLKVKVGTRKVDKSAASASADMATDVGMARDPAQDLTLQCKGQRLKLEAASQDGSAGRDQEVIAAVEARHAALGV